MGFVRSVWFRSDFDAVWLFVVRSLSSRRSQSGSDSGGGWPLIYRSGHRACAVTRHQGGSRRRGRVAHSDGTQRGGRQNANTDCRSKRNSTAQHYCANCDLTVVKHVVIRHRWVGRRGSRSCGGRCDYVCDNDTWIIATRINISTQYGLVR